MGANIPTDGADRRVEGQKTSEPVDEGGKWPCIPSN